MPAEGNRHNCDLDLAGYNKLFKKNSFQTLSSFFLFYDDFVVSKLSR